jgi:hypothetical protein
MPDPTPVPFPQPGDPDYVDHVELALSRLPEQFKEKREE